MMELENKMLEWNFVDVGYRHKNIYILPVLKPSTQVVFPPFSKAILYFLRKHRIVLERSEGHLSRKYKNGAKVDEENKKNYVK